MTNEKIGWIMLYSLLAFIILSGVTIIFLIDFWFGLLAMFLIGWLLVSIYLI